MRNMWTRVAAGALRSIVGGAALFWSGAAAATSCDMTAIHARSVQETATSLFEHSDYIGFGFVEDISDQPRIKQQRVHFVVALKGGTMAVPLAPKSVNRVSRVDGYQRWLYYPPSEMRMFALVRTDDGGAMHVCTGATIAAKPPLALYRALLAEAVRRGSVTPR